MISKSLISELENKERLSIRDLTRSSEWSQFEEISKALNIANPRQILYHAKINSVIIPNCKCGAPLKWHSDLRQYRKYCSQSCTAKYTIAEKKINNLEKFGVEWHSQLPNWNNKVKETNNKKYGADYYSQTEKYHNSVINSNLEKYGVPHIMQVDSIKAKLKQTNLEKYGVENPVQTAEIKEKIANTNIERYGVNNPLKNAEIKEKIANTNIERYGVNNPLKNAEIKEKSVKSKKENYYTPDVLEKLNNKEWLTEQHQSGESIWAIANKLKVNSSNLGKYFQKYNIPVMYHSTSEGHRRLYEHFKSLGFNLSINDRSIIPPNEIDLFFVDFNLAIEINGFYYHSEQFGKNKNYHLDKTIKCNNKNITLLHFWHSEIIDSWDKVVDIINSKLNLNQTIFARKCNIQLVSLKEKTLFLNKYHLQNSVGSNINLGLYYNNELVMITTFGKSRFTNDSKIELLRLCTKSNISVVGGASKLIKHFITQYLAYNQSLISYSDRRYSNGKVYAKIGMKQVAISAPGFFYINKQGNYAGTRYQFQKHLLKNKLSNFDNKLTAEENMKQNGYYKVWDCGHLIFEYTKENHE